MIKDSLLGHLARRLSRHPENIATEALTYLLRFEILNQAYLDYVQDIVRSVEPTFQLPSTIFFGSQEVGDDRAIPDILGRDNNNNKRLIVEAKFWAGLTANQPIGYLRHFKSIERGVLIFVAPETRMEILWHELCRRCEDSIDHQLIKNLKQSTSGKYRVSELSSGHFLVLTSWREVLRHIKNASNDELQLSDIDQLSGLCEKMDTDAFLPLSSEEITSQTIPRRQLQFYELVDKAMVGVNSAVPTGRSCNAGNAYYARSFSVNNIGLNVQLDYTLWSHYGLSPLWLSVREVVEGNWVLTPKVRRALSQLPKDSLVYPDINFYQAAYIPLILLADKEIDDVLGHIRKQILFVISLLENQSDN